MSFYRKPEKQTKEDYEDLCHKLSIARDGIELGNICHKLRCRYGLKYSQLHEKSGLMLGDFDELIREWDDAHTTHREDLQDLNF
jgi:hypothetical protein